MPGGRGQPHLGGLMSGRPAGPRGGPGGGHALESGPQTYSRRCTKSEWMIHKSTTISVIAHQGWTGMNTKLIRACRLTRTIPSHRAHAAPESTPKPAHRTTNPAIRVTQPHVEALVLIQ